jgi:uncharacterized RDD family membrane protein YckC
MSDSASGQPPGWYHAQGDPPGSQRYWDGSRWVGGPQQVPAGGGAPPAARDYLPELGRTLASPWRRIVARILDGFIVQAATFVLLAVLGLDGDVTDTDYFLVAMVFSAAYEIVLVATKGATLGKMALGVGVITTDGALPPGFPVAVRRWLPSLLGAIPLIGPLIAVVILVASLVWLFRDERRRTVYDRFAGTYVVSTR